MKKIYLLATMSLFSVATVFAQIKNVETKTFKVKGNCVSAKEMIETAGNQKRISTVSYNVKEGTAILTFDKTKTTSKAILKKIALAGFDNDVYFAPDNVYEKLAKDCRYTRDKKSIDHSVHSSMMHNHSEMQSHTEMNHANHEMQTNDKSQMIFDTYFKMKDAFVQANQSEILKQATAFKKVLSNDGKEAVSAKELTFLKDIINKIIQEKDLKKTTQTFCRANRSYVQVGKKR
jgi:copper chaperone CopZ